MANAFASPPWAYESRSNDPPVIKSAANEMADSISRVEGVDSVICPLVFSIGADGLAAESSPDNLTVDFKNRRIQLPKRAFSKQHLPSIVDDRLIRYAAFIAPPDYSPGGSNETHVVALSIWQQLSRDICNLYFVVNHSDALLLMNAVSRLVFGQSTTKAREFYPLVTGRVFISSCTSAKHSGNNPDCCGPQKLMFFILDAESLGFFEHSFSNEPTYDFRFYKERSPKAIDIVFVSKDLTNIHMRQGEQICIIRKNLSAETDIAAYDKLLNLFKGNVIKPKPENYFIDPEKHKMFDVSSQQSQYSRQEPRWQGTDQYGNESWINDLYTGDHIDRNPNEEMQLMWFTFEHDLKECIDNDTVPYSAFESGGLDPNSTDHLQRSVEDIKDQLLNNDMVLALSRLQACLNVFRETLLQPVSTLDQLTLMKRIYFLSGRD